MTKCLLFSSYTYIVYGSTHTPTHTHKQLLYVLNDQNGMKRIVVCYWLWLSTHCALKTGSFCNERCYSCRVYGTTDSLFRHYVSNAVTGSYDDLFDCRLNGLQLTTNLFEISSIALYLFVSSRLFLFAPYSQSNMILIQHSTRNTTFTTKKSIQKKKNHTHRHTQYSKESKLKNAERTKRSRI